MPETQILLVEDDFLIRLTLAEALSDDGFSVLEADSGEEGLRLLDGAPSLCLLLTDVRLAGQLDGFALAASARGRFPSLPVIFITGRSDDLQDRMTGRDLLIPKPYLPSQVCAAVRRMLAA